MLRLMTLIASFGLIGNIMAEVSCWGVPWKPYGQSELKENGQVITMTTQNPNSGMIGQVPVTPGRRYAVCCEVRGSGRAKVGICGSTGWNFSLPQELSDQWKTLSITYYEGRAAKVQIMVAGGTNGAADCDVRAVTVKAIPFPEWKDEEIAARSFQAENYPGITGKLSDAPGCPGRKAIYGKRWYCPVAVPVPDNSRELFYYCHLYKDNDGPVDLCLLSDGQRIHMQKWEGAAKNTWHWVRIGPVRAAAIYPRVSLNYQCAPEIGIWVDQVILSTNPALSATQLDSGE